MPEVEEHEKCVRVARVVAKSDSSFLRTLQIFQELHFSMNAQLTHEPIVHFTVVCLVAKPLNRSEAWGL